MCMRVSKYVRIQISVRLQTCTPSELFFSLRSPSDLIVHVDKRCDCPKCPSSHEGSHWKKVDQLRSFTIMAIRERSDHRQHHEFSGSNVGTTSLSPPVVSQRGMTYLPVFLFALGRYGTNLISSSSPTPRTDTDHPLCLHHQSGFPRQSGSIIRDRSL